MTHKLLRCYNISDGLFDGEKFVDIKLSSGGKGTLLVDNRLIHGNAIAVSCEGNAVILPTPLLTGGVIVEVKANEITCGR